MNKQRFATDSRGIEYDAGCASIGLATGEVFQVLASNENGDVVVDDDGIPVAWDEEKTAEAVSAFLAAQA